MASHLSVTSKSATGVPETRAFGTSGTAEPGAGDVFAALLGGAAEAVPVKAGTGSKVELSLGKLASLLLGNGTGGEAATDAEDPEAIAALVDATAPIQTTPEAKALLTDLIDGLATMQQALDAGETVDPELLAQINEALDALAAQFELDLSGETALEDIAALTAAMADGDTGAATQLTQALAPIAKSMLSGEAGAGAEPQLSAIIKALGDKLAALLQQINSGAISQDDLAAMGLKADAGVDAEIETALARLLEAAPKIPMTATDQPLAAPTLKLTEPTLTGKADPAAEPVASEGDAAPKPASAAGEPAATGPGTGAISETETSQAAPQGKKNDDAKPAAAVGTAASEARSEPLASTSTAPQTARIDATAAPARPVQPGYQTSQQQLNLPQLAFELVRQVNDGNTRFQMRLDPPELGRIEVKLDIDKSGQVNARLVVEKSETLDLMQRDQRALERALQQAGLDGAKTNLEFSLKQNPSGGGQQGRQDQGQQFSLNGMGAETLEEAPPIVNLYRGSLTASGVNIVA